MDATFYGRFDVFATVDNSNSAANFNSYMNFSISNTHATVHQTINGA
jgi:hypothetical protein